MMGKSKPLLDLGSNPYLSNGAYSSDKQENKQRVMVAVIPQS